jgi:hypothetical protein
MASNRVHLLKFRHVNITESANLSLRLRNLATSNKTISSFSSQVAPLFLSFSRKLNFDSECFFT